MKRILMLCLVAVLGLGLVAGFGETWKGSISDKMCGADHHGQDPVKCTLSCVKGGSPYVFVLGKDKVLDIDNQKEAKIVAQLEKFAGKTVSLTGSLGKDGKAVTIEKLEAAK